jgi:hypothetical protein
MCVLFHVAVFGISIRAVAVVLLAGGAALICCELVIVRWLQPAPGLKQKD